MSGVDVKLHRERPIDVAQVRQLYDHAAWWPNRRAEEIARVLEAGPAAGAWDGERLVGFARIVTDGIFHAYVEDVVVHDEYRRRGLGNALITRLLEEIREIETVSLFCTEHLVPFYGGHAFKPTRQVVMHRPRR